MCVALGCSNGPAKAPTATEACQQAAKAQAPTAQAICERAWQETGDVAAAVDGAFVAVMAADAASLQRWADRAPPTVEGARILQVWGELQTQQGDHRGAEVTLRRALALRVDRDPLRAANNALGLVELVRSTHPVEDTLALARTAWEQAARANHPALRARAALALVDLLVDLGELRMAEVVVERMTIADSPIHHRLAAGRVQAARGRHALAAALFRQAADTPTSIVFWRIDAVIELAHSTVAAGRTAEARRAIDEAVALSARAELESVGAVARLAAGLARVALAEGDLDGALAAVDRGLAIPSRDAARVQLLDLRGTILADRGDAAGAEAAWRQAADMLESWRASIPTIQLRSGVVAHQRHALEAWLESAARRGDVRGALEVTSRIVGRSLLDRLRHRAADAPAAVDASLADIVGRLTVRRELAATLGSVRDLHESPHDLVALMGGSHSIWALRRARGRWSIERVGSREEIVAMVAAVQRDVDDVAAASRLGGALFPVASLPRGNAPLAVLLDRELSEVALAGLRTGDRYLVEHAPILELLAPDLVFAPVSERSLGPAVALGDATQDLPGAAAEVTLAARALAGRLHLGPTATREAVIAAAEARVLHVATHATIQDGSASLVLHGGTLSAAEIVGLKIAPRVAVMATCRSQVNDDPVTSFAAAFLAAGSSGVVGVKRALDDGDGARLVEAFYRAGGADDPVRGLALAQRAAIAASRPPHTWATLSFFGVGGWLTTTRGVEDHGTNDAGDDGAARRRARM